MVNVCNLKRGFYIPSAIKKIDRCFVVYRAVGILKRKSGRRRRCCSRRARVFNRRRSRSFCRYIQWLVRTA